MRIPYLPIALLYACFGSLLPASDNPPIDRHALVTRHNPSSKTPDPLAPFSVGNGRFAFTADVTGLQSFPEHYQDGIPLAIQSEWGWHSFENSQGFSIEDTYRDFDTYGRPVPYPFDQHTAAGQFLRGNPHRLGLGRIGFEFERADGSIATIDDLGDIDQNLDLWSGSLSSRFTIEGVPVRVDTYCHPEQDLIAARVESPLIEQGRLRLRLQFGYGSDDWGLDPVNWTQDQKHRTQPLAVEERRLRLERILDAERHSVALEASHRLNIERRGPHLWTLAPSPSSASSFSFSLGFSPEETAKHELSDFSQTAESSRTYWSSYWSNGGAVSFAGSSDPRAAELERRVVLSQYLTAIQCRGSLPPQETGLTYNSWYGKPHLEMHWWHGTHFALWDRLPGLSDTLPWYQDLLPEAKAIAALQGYKGARWPKNVSPDGASVPSTIAPLLVWQQPHPIYFAELLYRQRKDDATLDAYRDLVFETAAFMASFAHFDERADRYHLGPPLIPAQESYDPTQTLNPPFELAYWRWGLETAQKWRERAGIQREPRWDEVIEKLAPYPTIDDLYATAEGVWNTVDHPTVLAAYGMIPGAGIDRERMRRTLRKVMNEWPWEHTWGWDYPMIAMTAARLQEPELALEALLLDVQKNTYLRNGHNFQEPERLRLYLPGNGGLLAAVAMMAAGWDGGPSTHAPGFPQDGSWTVRWENLHRMP